VDPSGGWTKGREGQFWARALERMFPQRHKCSDDPYACYSAEQLIKEVFLDSDTSAAVVSALWGGWNNNPTPIEYAAEARAIIERMGGRQRALIHGGVLPNQSGAIDFMQTQARDYGASAWKTYPQWGPEGVGYFMDDERYGIPMVEKARALGVKVICAHRGLPLPNLEYRYSHPADIARVAARYPDVTFICYHSGFESRVEEGPYRPQRDQGVDRLIRAHQELGFEPDRGNLYAELGSVWRYHMSRPDQAAHLLGKLLKYFGPKRICWGTDALWYGSPQDQIQALRSFRISEPLLERHGYPQLTDEARRRIFGLNAAEVYGLDLPAVQQAAARDPIARLKAVYRERPNPGFLSYGPRTRREFLRLQARLGGRPA
jgi:predicted TIM-barrel fold metal-dependent hydrolase